MYDRPLYQDENGFHNSPAEISMATERKEKGTPRGGEEVGEERLLM